MNFEPHIKGQHACKGDKRHGLTFRLDRAESGFSNPFFRTVGTEPGRILRLEPSKSMDLSKQSSEKCSEHITNLPVGLKFARRVRTNRIHFSRSDLFTGL